SVHRVDRWRKNLQLGALNVGIDEIDMIDIGKKPVKRYGLDSYLSSLPKRPRVLGILRQRLSPCLCRVGANHELRGSFPGADGAIQETVLTRIQIVVREMLLHPLEVIGIGLKANQ